MLSLGSLTAKELSNQDVIMMVEAGLDDATVVLSIQTSETDFDTSPMALVELKKAGVSEEVLQAMMNPKSGAATTQTPAGPPNETIHPELAVIKFSGQSEEMRYTTPTMRTKARAFGFGGVATYMVLRGSHATLKIDDRKPVFVVSVPERAQPEAYVDLASFAVRGNESREVLVGGGYMSYSTGIHPDRRIAFTAVPLADQGQATEGFKLYEVTPESDLESGEYALVFYNSEVATYGFFGHGANSCFDFAVN